MGKFREGSAFMLTSTLTRWAMKPEAAILSEFYDWDDTKLVPLNPLPVMEYDTLVTVDVNFTSISWINKATINIKSYPPANVPAIFTVLTTGAAAANTALYGNTTNTFVLNHLDMIWLIINNNHEEGHPCISLFFFPKNLIISSSSWTCVPSCVS